MFGLKYGLIDVSENLSYFLCQHFLDKVPESAIRRPFPVYQVHVPYVHFAIISQFAHRAVSFVAKANSTVFSMSTGLYLLLPVQFFRTSVRYLLISIPSMNRSNPIAESETERNSGILPCFGV